MAATFTLLTAGYAERPRVGSTCSLLRDGDTVVVIDPGMVADRRQILDPLEAVGLAPEDVTDVIFSHHHPDHTLNAALFPEARVHDHWAIYHHDNWTQRPADGFAVSPAIRLVETPGHTPQDITTVVDTADGLLAFTHLWWHAEGPARDPLAADHAALDVSRRKILGLSPALIVPGHGSPFAPSESTPG
jgi:glyoxylase-like metal-dependent hydrolase (beta-lactamase superfamily II)